MRIAVFVGSFPNTSETFVLNQITGLLDRGHEVFIFPSSSDGQGDEHEAVKEYGLRERTFHHPLEHGKRKRLIAGVKAFGKHFPRDPARMLRAINVFRHGRNAANLTQLNRCCFWLDQERVDFDIIFCHFGPQGRTACDLRQQGYISGRLVTVFHAFDLTQYPHKYGKDIYRELFANGDRFLTITSYAKEKLVDLGCPVDKIHIHHMGVDCARFAHGQRRLNPDEPLHVVTVGRMVEKKGFEYAIRAIAELVSRGRRVRGVLVGDGELRASLEELTRNLGVEGNVEFLGWRTQNQLLEILEKSHVLLAPSVTAENGDEEGLPVVLMEALAMGLPAVSTRHAGIPELIEDGETGCLVEERDVNALADKLCMLYDNHELYQRVSRQGRNKIEQEYDIDKLNDELIEVFKDVLNNG